MVSVDPIPDTRLPMPDARCPMPDARCPIPVVRIRYGTAGPQTWPCQVTDYGPLDQNLSKQ